MEKFLTALVLLLAGCAAAPPDPAWTIPQGIKTVRLPDGYPLAYEERGSGVAILLVHGALTDYRIWVDQVSPLSERFRVISVSLRRSYPEPWDGKGRGIGFIEQADDLAAMVRALGLDKPHVVAHSRGGAVALHLALRHPQLVRSLVLADSGGLGGLYAPTPDSMKSEAALAALYGRLTASFEKGDRNAAARGFIDDQAGAGSWDKRPADARQVVLDNLAAAAGERVGEWPKVSCEDIGRLTMPVLLLNGESSPKRYVELHARARECNPSLPPSVVIKGAGHNMHRQKAEEFNRLVTSFVVQH